MWELQRYLFAPPDLLLYDQGIKLDLGASYTTELTLSNSLGILGAKRYRIKK